MVSSPGGCIFLVLIASLIVAVASSSSSPDCPLDENIARDIKSYQPMVKKIIKEALASKGAAYKKLEEFVTKFGARPSGSQALENAIDGMKATVSGAGLRVTTEPALVPHWVRGEETLKMLRPVVRPMKILGLGGSVGTQQFPGGFLKARAVVVKTFDELEALGREKVQGKIVVLNAAFGSADQAPFERYRQSNKYRTEGSMRAAKLGASAVLVRSRTDFSLATPHTGWQQTGPPPLNGSRDERIPAAAITVEDSEMLQRLHDRGEPIELLMKMSAVNLPERISRDMLVEYGPASSGDREMVVLSAHLDSWDVGDGALDNGAGVFVNLESMLVLKRLALVPRRTLRSVFWTAEEVGYKGGHAYMQQHGDEMTRVQAAIENDLGSFTPLGMRINGSDTARCMLQHVMALLSSINATQVSSQPILSEVHLMQSKGVPALNIDTNQSRYFWYHHTNADTMSALDPDEMDLCVATMAATSYVLADMSHRLPR